MQPKTWEHWREIAIERAKDAESIAEKRPDSIGCVYMVGYAVECILKAYLQRKGVSFPSKGKEGHHLRALWETAGFRLSDINDRKGRQTFFIQEWTTDLRYEVRENDSYSLIEHQGFNIKELIEGAKQLSGWIHKKIKRLRRKR